MLKRFKLLANDVEQALLEKHKEEIDGIFVDDVKEITTVPIYPIQSKKKTKYNIDVDKLQLLIDGKHHKLKEKVRKALKEHPIVNDTKIGYSRKLFRKLTNLKVQKLLEIPEIAEAARIEDRSTRHDVAFSLSEVVGVVDGSLVTKLGVHVWLFGGAIEGLGDEKQYQQWGPGVQTLEHYGMFCMTETGHGSNVKAIETLAIYDKQTDEFIIKTPHKNAKKYYIGNGLSGNMSVVFARLILDRTDYGAHCFVVPIRDKNNKTYKGITIEDLGMKMGLEGVDNVALSFDNVRIPRDNMLRKISQVTREGKYKTILSTETKRFNATLIALLPTRMSLICTSLVAMKVGLSIGIKYALKRVQFGPKNEPEIPIMSYQSTQKRLIPLLATAYALDFTRKFAGERWTEHLKILQDDPVEAFKNRETEALISGLKAYTTWEANKALQNVREAIGGCGFMEANRIPALRRDCDIFTTFEGDNTVLYQQVAKDLLAQFASQFEGGAFYGMFHFLSMEMINGIKMVGSYVTIPTNSQKIDYNFINDALEYKEARLLKTLASRLIHKVKKGSKKQFVAWNECLDHLLSLAKVHIQRITFDCFRKAVYDLKKTSKNGVYTKGNYHVLHDLCLLYGVSILDEDKSWFYEHNYISTARGKAIRQKLLDSCKELSKYSYDLVDAWAIDDCWLGAINR